MKIKAKWLDRILVAAILLILGLIVYGKVIIGNETLYYQDASDLLANSYMDTCNALSQAIRDKAGLGYSFTVGFGNDTFALWAKLADPFTLLHVLVGVIFGTNAIGVALPFIQIIRSIAAGLVCFLFLGKFKFSRGSRVLASVLYGFSGFFFTVGQDFSQASLLVFLVFLLLCVDKAIENKRYFLLLALAIGFICLQGTVTMAVMLPVTVGYLIVQIMDSSNDKEIRITQSVYAVLAFVSGLLATSCVWVKRLLCESNTSASYFVESNLLAELGNSFSIAGLRQIKTALLRLLSNNLQGTAVEFKGYGTYDSAYPLFLSVLLVLCAIQFLYSVFWKHRKEALKAKNVLPLAGLAVYLLMYVTVDASPFFTQLSGVISVVFLPYLVYMIATTLDGIQKDGAYSTVLNAVVTVACTGFAFVYYTRKSTEVVQTAFVIMAVCMIMLAVLLELLYRFGGKQVSNVIIGVIFIVSCGNLLLDHGISLYADRQLLQQENVTEYETIIKEIKAVEGDTPYRVADFLEHSVPYTSEVWSVSADKDTVTAGLEEYVDFIGGMGYQEGNTVVEYQNYQFGMPFDADTANRLGIKYVITDTPRNDSDWTLFAQHGQYYAYCNNKFQGFGEFYQSSLAEVDYEVLDDMERLLCLQNAVVLNTDNTEKYERPEYTSSADSVKMDGIRAEGVVYQVGNHQIQCDIQNKSVITLPLSERQQSDKQYVNFFISVKESSKVKVELLTTEENNAWDSMKGISYFIDGTQELSMYLPSDVTAIDIGFDVENEAVISEPVISSVPQEDTMQGDIKWEVKDSGTLNGTVSCEEASVLYLPVAYDKNWHCYIDGVETELMKANYGFMALDLEAGTHNVTLSYEKQTSGVIWLVTLAGVLLFGLLTVCIAKKHLLAGTISEVQLAFDKLSLRTIEQNEKLAVGIVFLAGFVLLLMQHLTLDIFYDDYANAALCYGRVIEGVEGTNYTNSQLWEWVKWCYMNWGGRVLYAALFLIPLLRHSATAYMVIQVFVILLLMYLLYKIVGFYTEKKYSVWIAVILFILYGLVGRDIHVQGTYWASASILYIWPLVPTFWVLFAFAFLQKRLKNDQPVNMTICMPFVLIPTFFAAFSQEQTGIALLISLFLLIIIGQGKDWKKCSKLNGPVLITAIVSYVLIFAAPGNFARLETNEFSELSFFEKLACNMPLILDMFFSNAFLWLNLVVCLLICVMAVLLFLKNKKKYMIFMPLSICNALGVVALEKISLPDIIQSTFEMEFLIYLAVICGFYFYETKRSELMALVIGGAVSVFCLLMSPAVQHRSYLEYMFIVFVVIAIVAVDIRKALANVAVGRYLYTTAVLLCALKSVTMFTTLYSGYYENSFSLKYNHKVLSSYDGSQNELYLVKCENDVCRLQMPYDAGFEYIDSWLREYYDIPAEVNLIWQERPEKWRGSISTAFTDYQLSGDFYEDDWFGRHGVMTIKNDDVEKVTLVCYVDKDTITNNKLYVAVDGVTVEYPIEAGYQTIELDVSGKKNPVIEITAAETYIPQDLGISTDSRQLFGMLKCRVQ